MRQQPHCPPSPVPNCITKESVAPIPPARPARTVDTSNRSLDVFRELRQVEPEELEMARPVQPLKIVAQHRSVQSPDTSAARLIYVV